MLGKRQFSLGYLLLEMFWFATALGLIRASIGLPEEWSGAGLPLVIAGIGAGGAAIGGLSGHMLAGACIAIALVVLGCLCLSPAVMVA